MTFESLHEKYTRGDTLTDKELATLAGFVSRLATEIRSAPVSIIGGGTVYYLNILESNLRQICHAR